MTFILEFLLAGEMHKCLGVCRVVSGYVPCHVCAINKDSPG